MAAVPGRTVADPGPASRRDLPRRTALRHPRTWRTRSRRTWVGRGPRSSSGAAAAITGVRHQRPHPHRARIRPSAEQHLHDLLDSAHHRREHLADLKAGTRFSSSPFRSSRDSQREFVGSPGAQHRYWAGRRPRTRSGSSSRTTSRLSTRTCAPVSSTWRRDSVMGLLRSPRGTASRR